MSSTLRRFSETYRRVTHSILEFCAACRFEPTWQQKEFLLKVEAATFGRGCRRIARKSGQGPGKSRAAAAAMCWRALQDVDSLTIVTAPTMRQCRDIPIVEAGLLLQNADPMIRGIFKITKTKVEIMGRPNWGVKLVTATKSENFSGYHNPGLTFIVEEAAGVGREITETIKGTLTNRDSLLVMIGNPNTRDCDFFDCFNSQRSLWDVGTWNAEETARDYPWLLDPERNRLIEEEFGKDSDVYRIRVLGEFPHRDPNCVLSSEELDLVAGNEHMVAASRLPRDEDAGGGYARQFGMDLARYGGDESTVFQRSGNAIIEWDTFAHLDPSRVVDQAFKMQHTSGWADHETVYVVDAGGMGQGVMHRFYDAGRTVVEFHNGGRPFDSKTYKNRITEGWFKFAKKVRDRRCMIPRDNLAIQQLCTRRFFTDKDGLIVLEKKDDYIKRGFDSPDRADGIVYAFEDHVQVVGHIGTRSRGPGPIGVRAYR